MSPRPASSWRKAPTKSPTPRERIAVLRHVPPFIRLVWQTHRGLTLAMMALRLARGLCSGRHPVGRFSGAITLGSLTFLAASFMRSRDLVQRLLSGAGEIYSQSLYLKDLFDFFETRPTIISRPGAPPVPRPLLHGFVFEDVGFRYPDSDLWALRGVTLSLRPGNSLASMLAFSESEL